MPKRRRRPRKAACRLRRPAAASNVSTAQGSVEQSRRSRRPGAKGIEAAHARLDHGSGSSAGGGCQRRQGGPRRRTAARSAGEGRDLAAACSIPRSPPPTRNARRPIPQVAGGRSRSRHSRRREPAGRRRAPASSRRKPALRSAQTGPEQIAATRARAASAEARVQQAKASLTQAELNLQYTVDQGADQGRRQPQDGRSRAGRPARPAAHGADSARRRCGSPRTSRRRSCATCAPASRSRSRSMPTAGASSTARSTASRPPPARASACCRRRTPPATTSRSCSACR